MFSKVGECEEIRDFGEVVVHDDDVSCLDSGFRAGGAHGNTDVGAAKDRRVVNSVADEDGWSGFGDSFKTMKLVGW